MELSRFIFETFDATGQSVLLNSVTGQILSRNATRIELQEQLFLAGDEDAAIQQRLHRRTDKCAFTLINTWECNLRCNHCTVLDKLKRQDTSQLDAQTFANFLERFIAYYQITQAALYFLGGEPLLYSDRINSIIVATNRLNPTYGITTNLAMELTPERLDCLRRLNSITVSLDGLEEAHNEQRRPLCGSFNPFRQTLGNLKILVKEKLHNRIIVQATLKDRHLTTALKGAFLRSLFKIGIGKEQISFGCLHPTRLRPTPTEAYKQVLASAFPAKTMCCKYRYYNLVVDTAGAIFSDYYSWVRIGTITDNIKRLDREHHRLVLATMPALNDPKCRRCEVLGYCWGGCSSGDLVAKGRPSDHCNQPALLARVSQMARNGELIEY